jgi:hypothetical protein
MNLLHKWFAAEGIFEARISRAIGDVPTVRETLLFLVRADDVTSAKERAEGIARAKEHSYANETGETVQWVFVRITEVTEVIDQSLEEGAEIKSTLTERPQQQTK